MAEKQTKAEAEHGASTKIKQKADLYAAQYLGSGTFQISKPKRQAGNAGSPR